MNSVAIIPARGGSKRIPKKNVRLFFGKPMIAWPIEVAKKSGLFDRIIVSTDSEKIAEIARESGAETPFKRPKKLADDFTGTNDVVKHALQWLIGQGENIKYACCIYATAPFLKPEYLKEGFEILKAGECTFVFSVTSYAFPIQRSIKIRSDGYVDANFPGSIPMRSQDLEEAYHDAGQFYWGSPESFIENKPIFSSGAKPVVLPRYLVQDIDTMEDWEMAEYMYKALQSYESKI